MHSVFYTQSWSGSTKFFRWQACSWKSLMLKIAVKFCESQVTCWAIFSV